MRIASGIAQAKADAMRYNETDPQGHGPLWYQNRAANLYYESVNLERASGGMTAPDPDNVLSEGHFKTLEDGLRVKLRHQEYDEKGWPERRLPPSLVRGEEDPADVLAREKRKAKEIIRQEEAKQQSALGMPAEEEVIAPGESLQGIRDYLEFDRATTAKDFKVKQARARRYREKKREENAQRAQTRQGRKSSEKPNAPGFVPPIDFEYAGLPMTKTQVDMLARLIHANKDNKDIPMWADPIAHYMKLARAHEKNKREDKTPGYWAYYRITSSMANHDIKSLLKYGKKPDDWPYEKKDVVQQLKDNVSVRPPPATADQTTMLEDAGVRYRLTVPIGRIRKADTTPRLITAERETEPNKANDELRRKITDTNALIRQLEQQILGKTENTGATPEIEVEHADADADEINAKLRDRLTDRTKRLAALEVMRKTQPGIVDDGTPQGSDILGQRYADALSKAIDATSQEEDPVDPALVNSLLGKATKGQSRNRAQGKSTVLKYVNQSMPTGTSVKTDTAHYNRYARQ